MHRLAGEVAQIATALGDDGVARIRGLLEDAAAKEDAARLAAQKAFADQPLPNVGSEVWRLLWESARRYSKTEAYPDEQFPVTEGEARCVLCQQPLSAEAAARLRRFEDFICEDTQQRAHEARRALTAAANTLAAIGLGPRNYRESMKDVGLENDQLAGEIRRFLVQTRLRRRWIMRSCRCGTWLEPLVIPNVPVDAVATLSQEMLRRAQELDLAASSEHRQELQKALDELVARQWLSGVLDDVRTEIDRQQKLNKLSSANGDTSTTWITRKNGDLTHQYVTEALCLRFTREAARLGAEYLQVQLVPVGGQYGSMRFRIQLNGAQQAANVPDVLSEGEYRCIALAGFLAELATSDSHSGLVFDDPVCSLDHRWRRLVAERLVKEARSRQVIVLTHDVVFLVDLADFCKLHRIPLSQACLRRDHRGSGVCMDGVPWIAMGVRQRIGVLNDRLQQAGAAFNGQGYDAYEPLARDLYGLLRETWERGVEELLLGGVVERYRRSVQTLRLQAVTDITEADVRAVEAGMTKCSRFLRGHDEAAAINDPIPEPSEVREDVQLLDQWARAMRSRRQ
jgi:hypothetical protein